MVKLAGVPGLNGIDGQVIEGSSVGQALFQSIGDIVRRMKREAAALHRQDLQREVTNVGLAGLGGGIEKLLIVAWPRRIFASADRIDAVKRGAGLGDQIGHADHIAEELLLGFVVYLARKVRKFRPTR